MRSLFDSILFINAIPNKFKIIYLSRRCVFRAGLVIGLLGPLTTFAQHKKEQLVSGQASHILPTADTVSTTIPDQAKQVTEDSHASEKLANKFYIQEIILEGAKFLNKRTRKRLIAPYLNTYLDAKKIRKLVRTIRAYYIERGYPTTQVKVVLGQNLKEGVLKLMVSIGFIEEIIFNDHKRRDRGKIAMAFPWFRNRRLYLPYLEQGIDQINSVPSSHATLRILPGLREGGSVIQIDHATNKPIRFDIGGDNMGKKNTGKWRWKYHLSIDNLFRVNDSWALYYDTNHAKEVSGKKLRDHSLMAKLSFPLGYFNLSTTHSMRSCTQAVGKHQGLYKAKSTTHNYEIKFPIYKYRISKGTVSLQLDHLITDNHIDDVPISVQNIEQTQLKIETHHTGLIFVGQYVLKFEYGQQLPWLRKAEKQNPQVAKDEKPTFRQKLGAVDYQLSWMRPFSVWKKLLSYKFECLGLYALNGHEVGFNPASSKYVRGFEDAKDCDSHHGICFKQELSFHHLFSFARWLFPLELQTGIEMGYAHQLQHRDVKSPRLSAMLMSLVGGFHYDIKWLSLDFTYAKPLYASKHLAIPTNTYQILFSFNLKLHGLLP